MKKLRQDVQRVYDQGTAVCFEGLYQLVNHQAIAPFFRQHLVPGGRILDAGCGSGYLAEELGLPPACYVDLAMNQMKRCRDRLVAGWFVQADLEHLPFPDGCFDVVICSNVLHYTGPAGLRELWRVTKAGGQLLLAFLEGSIFTRAAINLAVWLGLFPPVMLRAQLLHLMELDKLNLEIRDSATITFFPTSFQACRGLPRLGLVAFEAVKSDEGRS